MKIPAEYQTIEEKGLRVLPPCRPAPNCALPGDGARGQILRVLFEGHFVHRRDLKYTAIADKVERPKQPSPKGIRRSRPLSSRPIPRAGLQIAE